MQRISGLDGVRALAIALVVGVHILSHNPSVILRWMFGGQDGVGLFFVLSGFLVTALLLKEREATGRIDIPHFYFRRAMRIVPPLAFYLLFVSALGGRTGERISGSALASVAFFYHNMMSRGPWTLEHTWSLAVEEQFYLLWPVVLVLLLRSSWRVFVWVSLGLILCAPVFRAGGYALHLSWMHHKEAYLLPTRMDALLAGCVTAASMGSRKFEEMYRRLAKVHWVAPCFLFVVSPWLSRRFWIAWDYSAGFTLNALFGAFFVLWLSRNEHSVAGRVANWPPVAKIGAMSYSIYLWQTMGTHSADGWTGVAKGTAFLAAMTLISFHCVERPAGSARSFLERRYFRREAIEVGPREVEANSAPLAESIR